MGGFVRVERRGAVGLVTLTRPEAANALNLEVLGDLERALDELEPDTGVRALVVTGEGRAFSAGGDIPAMRDLPLEGARAFVEGGHRFMSRLADSRLVSVAAVNGPALGGGCELAVACDLRVADGDAVLGYPEVQLGLIAGWGGTQRAIRLLGPGRAKALLLTGERWAAADAMRIGLVDRVAAPGKALAAALALAERIAQNSPSAVLQTKRSIAAAAVGMQEGLRMEVESWMVNFAHPDRREGLSAYLERREPQWVGWR